MVCSSRMKNNKLFQNSHWTDLIKQLHADFIVDFKCLCNES